MEVGDCFNSFAAFKEVIDRRREESNEKLVIGKSSNSVKSTNAKLKGPFKFKEELVYTHVNYRCIHEGTFHTKGHSQESTSFKNGCPVHIKLKADRICNQLRVVSVVLEHNHVLPRRSAGVYTQDRKLTEAEQTGLSKLIRTGAPVRNIVDYVSSEHDKKVKVKDIHNLRQKMEKLAAGGQTREQQVWASLEQMCKDDKGAHYSVFAQDGVISTLFFQTSHMRKIFQSYPDVLFIDSTYCLNQLSYPVVVFMVVDGDNNGQCVGYAIVRDEKMATLTILFNEFVKKNGVVDVKTVVVDKDASEIGALRLAMPDCQLVLCRFHVAKSLYDAVVKHCAKGERDEMHRQVRKLLMCRSEETFFTVFNLITGTLKDYLVRNWLPILDSWANFKTQFYVTWGNKTNNFVERHNRSLKTIASSKTTLPAFVAALLVFHRYQENKLRQKMNDLRLRSKVFRPKDVGCAPILERAYSLFLPSACELIKSELNKLHDNVSFLSGTSLTAYKPDGTEIVYNLEDRVCQCAFFIERRLPCWHLLEFCQKNGIDCLAGVPERYSKRKYLECLDGLSVDSQPISSGRIEVVDSGREKTELEKRVIMKELSKELVSVGAACGQGVFDRRVKFLRKVLTSWKAGVVYDEIDMDDDVLVSILEDIGDRRVEDDRPVVGGNSDTSQAIEIPIPASQAIVPASQAIEIPIPASQAIVPASQAIEIPIPASQAIVIPIPASQAIEIPTVEVFGDVYTVRSVDRHVSDVTFEQRRSRGRPKGEGVTSGHFARGKKRLSLARDKSCAKRRKTEVCGICTRCDIDRVAYGNSFYEWVDCTTCSTWYHTLCLGLPKAPRHYVCSQCTS